MIELIHSVTGTFILDETGLYLTAALLGPVFLNLLLNIARFSSASSRALPTSGPLVSIMIPARNEAHNLPRLLESIKCQTYPDVEVRVYDDGSEDDTWQVLQGRPHVHAERGDGPPAGWMGKVNALYRLSRHAEGEIYLFLDADTELRDDRALARMVRTYQDVGNGLITGITHLRGDGHLLVSVIGYMILSSIPWWMGRHLPSRFMAAVNGQCWMIDAALYHEHEPHEAVRSQVLEDVMLGRYMYSRGICPRLVNFQREVSVFMYVSLADAWLGFRKNGFAMVGGKLRYAVPIWILFAGMYVALPLMYLPALLATFVMKFLSDRFIHVSPAVSVLAPLSFVMAAALILDSGFSTLTGRAQWKGRSLAAASST